jgi:CheY-like chemotaxis protein/HPt (histidine-containing phosphotransfer) domain-containing protein
MNAILGMIELLLRKELDANTRDCLNTARESADLLLSLLNDLLDSAKIESGKLELESAPLSIRRILDQTARVLSVRASDKGLAFDCRVPDDMPDAVIGDEVRLQQVILNLAGNAIKFTERGEVAVSVHVESLAPQETRLKFAIRDTGIGIPRGNLERLFRPFVQADASTTRRFGGSGLGLSISANLVALMGGRIWAESEPGQGSTFHFTIRLPLAKELPAEREPAPQAAVLPAGPLRILLVEDNLANQKLATYIFKEGGHAIDLARDGQQALQMTEHGRYDAILMDVQMPGMDGLETTAAIRAREDDGRHVPIIAVTARAMKGDRERCLAAGMDGYLSKPINVAEMFAMITGLASGSAGAGANAVPASANRAGAAGEPAALGKSADIFDVPLALERCGQSREMLAEIVECFFEDADRLFPLMQAALESDDLEDVGRLAHRLKGTLVCLGVEAAIDAAAAVERCGPDGRAAVGEAVEVLRQQVESLKLAVAAYRPAGGSGE